MKRSPGVWVFLLAGLLLVPSTGALADGSLEQLMRDLASVRERQARFVEERRLEILDAPLVTEGTLSYQAPDRLIRQDLTPDPALYSLEGDRLRVVAGDQERIIALDQQPALRSTFEPFLALFAGDTEALERAFEVSYAGDEQAWHLTLVPRPGSAGYAPLAEIDVAGAGDVVQEVILRERDGDETVMRLSPTSP